MKELIKLSRELVENLFSGNKQKLGKEYFFMFSISKFILLKEKILKKDSANNIIYFNNIKNAKYIPAILSFAEEIKKNSSYQFNQITVKLEEINEESKKLIEAIWFFNKVRDSLAHGQYKIDLENDSIIINNDHSSDINNPYKLVCSIPINLLNSISFYIEGIYNELDEKSLPIAYQSYMNGFAMKYNIDTKKFVDSNFIIKINKYYDNKLNFSNYYDDNYINKYYSFDDENVIENRLSPFEISDNSIYLKILNYLSREELSRLVKLLVMYKPTNKKTQNQVLQIFQKHMALICQQNKLEDDEYDVKSSELMNEISNILGIKLGTKNIDGIIALYNYMVLVFSQNSEIDYSHICLRNIIINFDPYNNKNGTRMVYDDTINYIKKLCMEFSGKMDIKISEYYKNPNESFRRSLMSIYAEFYTSIMRSISNRNKLILTSIRNSIEHGNYYVKKNGCLILYDQTDHSDNKSIKFLCSSFPQHMFEITKDIELGNAKDNYIMDDFFKELETIVGTTTLMNTINNFSKIVFGKEIDINNSMEHMYHEVIANAVANIISQQISKK